MSAKKILILIIILVVLLGIGAAAYIFTKTPDSSNDTGSSRRGFNPFGNNDVGSTEIDTPKDHELDQFDFEVGDDGVFLPPKMRSLSRNVVIGASFFESVLASSTIRFIERETGHVYEAYLDNPDVVRISNTTVPRLQVVMWGDNGNILLLQYLDDTGEAIESFVARVDLANDETNDGFLTGSFLPQGNLGAIANRLTDDVFYMMSSGDEIDVFVSDNFGSSNSKIMTTPIKDWNVSWSGETVVSMTTKPAFGVGGFLYELNSNTGSFNKVLGPVNGLTTLTSPYIDLTLYSEIELGTFSLNTYDIDNNSSTRLSLTTLPEKCAWSPKNTSVIYCAVPKSLPGSLMPDAWYQGSISFDDVIWKIDVESGLQEVIVDLEEFANNPVDAIELVVNKDETALLARDKGTGELWLIDLSQ